MRRRLFRLLATSVLIAAASTLLGCWAVAKRSSDRDRAPVVNTGAGASVIYPGQSAPPHPGNYHPREAGYGQGVTRTPGPGGAPAPGAPVPGGVAGAHVPPGAVAPGVAVPPPEYAQRSGRSSGSGGGGGGITMIGGAEMEETKHISVNEEPRWLKYAALPFALIAAPFKYGAEKIRGEPEAGPEIPRNSDQARPQQGPPVMDYETARLQDMERELAQRGAAPGAVPQATPPPYAGAPPAYPAPGSGASGIADELAALRLRTAPPPAVAPPPSPGVAPAPEPRRARALPRRRHTPPRAEPPRASGEVDRNGDGRVDHWIHRQEGAVVRERFDENFDGRADRELVYDPQSHEVVRIEEDADHDGRLDSWTALRDGQVVGRRVDGDGDGHVDSWSTYHDGVITRLERDANGDGFRDHVAFYREGRLAREERDDDGDGRTDLVKHFDAGERVERVEEDADGDGEMDVVSHYEGGRLIRREVLDTAVLDLDDPTRTETR